MLPDHLTGQKIGRKLLKVLPLHPGWVRGVAAAGARNEGRMPCPCILLCMTHCVVLGKLPALPDPLKTRSEVLNLRSSGGL